jgi:hypothetical protein
VAINHTAGTHPTALLEVGFYAANPSSYLPDAFIGKVEFSLSAIGKKTADFSVRVSVQGLFWAIVRPTLGDTAFRAGGNGVSLACTGYAYTINNPLLAMLFGYGLVSGGVSSFFGYMSPSRSNLLTTLPTSSVLSEIVLQQHANINGGFPTVIVY